MSTATHSAACWLFVDLAEDFGGHEVMLLRWMEALRAATSVRPVLLCAAGSRLAATARANCDVECVAPTKPGASKFAMLSALWRVLSCMRRLKHKLAPELVIVAEGGLMAQRHGLYVARLLRLRTVLYVPIVDSFSAMQVRDAARLDDRVRSFYAKLPNAWLTITAEQAAGFRQWSGARQPVFELPNTVARSIEDAAGRFLPQSARDADKRLRVLVLGRLDRYQKGLDLLLDHLRQSPSLASEMAITLCGEGPYRVEIEAALAANVNLRELLCLRPWSDPLQAFAGHDVLLITSRFEGVPLVMLEAMCAGLPVVASDLPGIRPYIDAACRYPVGQLDSAFACLSQLHRSETLRREIALRNLDRFKSLASGAAFAAAVGALAPRLRQLAHS